MCLLVLAWNAHPRYRLVPCRECDEYHERACGSARQMARAERHPRGARPESRRRVASVSIKARRFGVVTNFPRAAAAAALGALARPAHSSIIRRSQTPERYLARLETDAPGYSGFNLLVGDADQLWYASNRMDRFAQALPAGVHGLSNEFLDSPWPKLQRVRRSLRNLARRWDRRYQVAATSSRTSPPCWRTARTRARGSPGTELPEDWERTTIVTFRPTPDLWNTVLAAILLIEPSGALVMAERRFDSTGRANAAQHAR